MSRRIKSLIAHHAAHERLFRLLLGPFLTRWKPEIELPPLQEAGYSPPTEGLSPSAKFQAAAPGLSDSNSRLMRGRKSKYFQFEIPTFVIVSELLIKGGSIFGIYKVEVRASSGQWIQLRWRPIIRWPRRQDQVAPGNKNFPIRRYSLPEQIGTFSGNLFVRINTFREHRGSTHPYATVVGQMNLNNSRALENWKGQHSEFLTTQNARFLLSQVYGALERFGLEPVILFGTLLGAQRDGEFIAHDKDIDIGILLGEKETKPGHEDSFTKNFSRITFLLGLRGIRLVRNRRGIKSFWFKSDYLDIYIFRHRGDGTGFQCGKYSILGQEAASFAFPTIEGRPYRAPGATDEYLSRLYGPGWRVPQVGVHAKS
jgi:hypothetical protein